MNPNFQPGPPPVFLLLPPYYHPINCPPEIPNNFQPMCPPLPHWNQNPMPMTSGNYLSHPPPFHQQEQILIDNTPVYRNPTTAPVTKKRQSQICRNLTIIPLSRTCSVPKLDKNNSVLEEDSRRNKNHADAVISINRHISVESPTHRSSPSPKLSNSTSVSNEETDRPLRVFVGRVTSLEGDLGVIDEETIFHISAVISGTPRPKVGDMVVGKAEMIRMPGFKWNAKEVQLLHPEKLQTKHSEAPSALKRISKTSTPSTSYSKCERLNSPKRRFNRDHLRSDRSMSPDYDRYRKSSSKSKSGHDRDRRFGRSRSRDRDYEAYREASPKSTVYSRKRDRRSSHEYSAEDFDYFGNSKRRLYGERNSDALRDSSYREKEYNRKFSYRENDIRGSQQIGQNRREIRCISDSPEKAFQQNPKTSGRYVEPLPKGQEVNEEKNESSELDSDSAETQNETNSANQESEHCSTGMKTGRSITENLLHTTNSTLPKQATSQIPVILHNSLENDDNENVISNSIGTERIVPNPVPISSIPLLTIKIEKTSQNLSNGLFNIGLGKISIPKSSTLPNDFIITQPIDTTRIKVEPPEEGYTEISDVNGLSASPVLPCENVSATTKHVESASSIPRIDTIPTEILKVKKEGCGKLDKPPTETPKNFTPVVCLKKIKDEIINHNPVDNMTMETATDSEIRDFLNNCLLPDDFLTSPSPSFSDENVTDNLNVECASPSPDSAMERTFTPTKLNSTVERENENENSQGNSAIPEIFESDPCNNNNTATQVDKSNASELGEQSGQSLKQCSAANENNELKSLKEPKAKSDTNTNINDSQDLENCPNNEDIQEGRLFEGRQEKQPDQILSHSSLNDSKSKKPDTINSQASMHTATLNEAQLKEYNARIKWIENKMTLGSRHGSSTYNRDSQTLNSKSPERSEQEKPSNSRYSNISTRSHRPAQDICLSVISRRLEKIDEREKHLDMERTQRTFLDRISTKSTELKSKSGSKYCKEMLKSGSDCTKEGSEERSEYSARRSRSDKRRILHPRIATRAHRNGSGDEWVNRSERLSGDGLVYRNPNPSDDRYFDEETHWPDESEQFCHRVNFPHSHSREPSTLPQQPFQPGMEDPHFHPGCCQVCGKMGHHESVCWHRDQSSRKQIRRSKKN